MDYEKAYKEALERAKNLHEDAIDMGENIRAKQCEIIFPELAETEEEKNIKDLIDELKCSLRAANCQNDACRGGHEKRIALLEWAIAWVEKQGTPSMLSQEEQNEFAKCVLTSCALSFINYLDAHKYEGKMCVSNGECKDIENAFHNAMWDRLHRYYCKYIEKQGETSPVHSNSLNIGKGNEGKISPKWTDEDEVNWSGIIDEIKANKSEAPDYDFETYDRFLSWLDNIKQRLGGEE